MRLLKSRSFWLLIISFTLSFGLLHLSGWKEDLLKPEDFSYPWNIDSTWQSIYKRLFPHKSEIGFYFGGSLLLLQVILVYFPLSFKRKKFIRDSLGHIINENLNGDVKNNRISIYEVKYGYEIIHKFIWLCLIKNFLAHYKKQTLKIYLTKEFPSPFQKYLVLGGRRGNPHENGTSTKFRVASNEKEISGIVSYVFYKESAEFVTLPDISSIKIDEYKKLGEIESKTKRDLVQRYMKIGKVNSFEKLKTFHRFPVKIYAAPIVDKQNDVFGVIVFDSTTGSIDYSQNLDTILGYCKLIERIIIYINK